MKICNWLDPSSTHKEWDFTQGFGRQQAGLPQVSDGGRKGKVMFSTSGVIER